MRTHAKVASKCLTRHLHEISAAWGGWRVAGAGKSNKVPTKPEFIAFVDGQFYWNSSAAACNKLILENTEAQKDRYSCRGLQRFCFRQFIRLRY